jgi:hypothetical protein
MIYVVCTRKENGMGKSFSSSSCAFFSKKKMEITMFNELVKPARWLNTMTHYWPHGKDFGLLLLTYSEYRPPDRIELDAKTFVCPH